MILIAQRGALAPGVEERRLHDARRVRGGFAKLRFRARQALREFGIEGALERGFVGKRAGECTRWSQRTGRSGAACIRRRHAASKASVCLYHAPGKRPRKMALPDGLKVTDGYGSYFASLPGR